MPVPGSAKGILSSPGSQFGLGRIRPDVESGLATFRMLSDLTPAGDVMAIYEGLRDQDPLGIGLGAASLLLPGTIKPIDFNKFKKAKEMESLKRREEATEKVRQEAIRQLESKRIENAYYNLRTMGIRPKYKPGDKFVTENGVRLEILGLDAPVPDGRTAIPAYRVRQTFPDGHTAELRASDKNLDYHKLLSGPKK